MKPETPHAETEVFACPVTITVDVIGGKWKALILFYLMTGTLRFNELRRSIPEVSQRMLTLQLRELEADNIIIRKVYREVPPKVEYSLAPLGLTLVPLIRAMRDWGATYEDVIKTSRKISIDKSKIET
ncbi:winged helix-turn-helix transcriptional regulator [Paenalcaligenes hominis]|uniref:winged helix-turn-helix transcriptional regulator n=1 Tax=Paenalcaligenes hominis TaxID=643674 RepID=UPI003524F71D